MSGRASFGPLGAAMMLMNVSGASDQGRFLVYVLEQSAVHQG